MYAIVPYQGFPLSAAQPDDPVGVDNLLAAALALLLLTLAILETFTSVSLSHFETPRPGPFH